ncbi:MAG: excinuclease ABC subunit UvrA [Deltaproteobacteria bacterium]|nr:excinuclease ABC subunit UvrA [Deltaproteobacteria bacterium]
MQKITIKGATEHNLKGFDLELPRDSLVVITGVSGSGKSSLAFDTIYAEGQRRYVESLSAYARQFLDQMDKPEVESIEGLSPAIAIEQKTTSKNPRSTVGTVTEIYDYLRLLFARVGKAHCYRCGKQITSQAISQMVDRVAALKAGTKVLILAPVVRGRKGEYRKEFEDYRRHGYTRVRVDGELKSLEEPISLDKRKKHDIDVVVDRVIIKGGVKARLADSFEVATALSGGLVKVDVLDGRGKAKPKEGLFFNVELSCVDCGVSYPEITPTTFSFNSPSGACAECGGIGEKSYFDVDLIIPDTALPLDGGVVLPWSKKGAKKTVGWFEQVVDSLGKHYGFSPSAPFKSLKKAVVDVLLYGSGSEVISFNYTKGNKSYTFEEVFEGILPNLERRYKETNSEDVRSELDRYMNSQPCPDCKGARLMKESLHIKVGGNSMWDVVKMPIKKSHAFFESLKFDETDAIIAKRIMKEIIERLGFLLQVGLGYITLDRSAATLSGGEGQRIRLATQIGSSLTGVLYILDEPSIGLHQRDNMRLLSALKRLRDMGNSVIVVEHDEETIRAADFVIDMGPGAGAHGGEVVFAGTPKAMEETEASLTGRYLSGKLSIDAPLKRKKPGKKTLTLKGVRENNLKGVDLKVPLGLITCVTGVSGSGKSTLIIDTLYRQLTRRLYGSKERAGHIDSIRGIEHIDKVIAIDQSPIGRTPRSNPATYTGVFTPIRELFTRLPEAKLRGYGPGRFSFNVKGGRCEPCKGDGLIKVEMHFLPDVYVHCDVCNARRYNRETLDVRYKGKNIADCLEMTVTAALEFFDKVPSIKEKLKTLDEVGLGYIRLGQSAITLSGGEAQRIKLAKELSKRATGKTIYILDEPTTGLHFADIEKLLQVLRRLSESGNTIVIIEHNLDVIKTSDHVIDLGPEGGDKGGLIVVEGTPEVVAKEKKSHTGEFLSRVLL